MLDSLPRFALALLLSVPAGAQSTWYADPVQGGGGGTGTLADPFQSLQVAVDTAISGDTVLILSSMFEEAVVVDGKEIQIAPAPSVVVDWSPLVGSPALELVNGGQARIQGVSLLSRNATGGAGIPFIQVSPGTECSLKDLTCEVAHDGWRWAQVDHGVLTAEDCDLISGGATEGASGAEIDGGLGVFLSCWIQVDTAVASNAPFDCSALRVRDAGSLLLISSSLDALGLQQDQAAAILAESSSCSIWSSVLTSHDGFGHLLEVQQGSLESHYSLLRSQSTNFWAPVEDQALRVTGATVDLRSTEFLGWSNETARAIGLIQGTGTVMDCRFASSLSVDWGAPISFSGPNLVVQETLFEHLTCDEGGSGVRAEDVDFLDCTFRDCFGARHGALAAHGSGVIEGCHFEDCWTEGASYCEPAIGGGVASPDPIQILNCTFIRNRSEGNICADPGEGAAIHAPQASVESCTFVENVCLDGQWGAPAGPTVVAAMVEGCLFLGELPVAVGAANVATYSLNSGQPGLGNLTGTPRFVDEAAGDYRLLPCSVGIDAGDPSCMDEFGTVCEMGAFSFDPADDAQVETICGGSPAAVCPAQLSVTGCASLGEGGVPVTVDQLEPGAFGMLLVGLPEAQAAAHASLLCVSQPLLQYEPGNAQGAGACGGSRSFTLDPDLLGFLGIGAGDSLVLSYVGRRLGNPGALEVSNGVEVGPLR